MNLTSPSQVKAWCIGHDFHPNKTLGQNFLIDKNILDAIVDAGLEGVGDDETILEIGPGLGVMTQEILRRGHDVVAVEKDPFLAEGLAERVGGEVRGEREEGRGKREEVRGELTVVTADALDVIGELEPRNSKLEPRNSKLEPRTSKLETRTSKLETLISNLPYQAGTRILLELVQRRELKSMTVLLQTEVAERLAAKEGGGRDRSLAGVWAQLDYDVKVVRKVGASCFWPRPEVGSSVAKLVRHERNASLTDAERKVFHRITKQAFSQRRKQLGTIFKKDAVIAKLWNCEIPDSAISGFQEMRQRRPEELSVEEWINLAKGIVYVDS